MNRIFYIITILFFVNNNAVADTAGARKFVSDAMQRVFTIIKQDKDISLIREDLITYIKLNIDINWIAKFVLGKRWSKLSRAEQGRFVKIFEQYLILNYAPRFEGYNNETYQISEVKEVGSKKYIGLIDIILENGNNIPLKLYILEKSSNIYKIVDISGAGVSFAATQRAEFNTVISGNGMDKFLDMLEQKLADLTKK